MSESVDMAEDSSRTIATANGRTVGYCIVEPEGVRRTSAIVYFYPLSGCSLVIANMAPALQNYRASILCVDRPRCAETSDLVTIDHVEDQSTCDPNDFAIARIQGHIEDVLSVLEHERIHEVYVLGVCIGHPFAVELCRQLLQNLPGNLPKIKGLTLVAPFVSTASPHSWRVARLGNSVPSFVLYGATETLVSAGSFLLPVLLQHNGPSMLKGLVTEEEQKEFDWTDEDFQVACENAVKMGKLTDRSKAVEARLGAVDTWQTGVCDQFAVESGCGLLVDTDNPGDAKGALGKPVIPIRIHACVEDKLATFASVEWVVNRCYSGCEVIVEGKIRSHEVMTFFGGPPRNPVLMHKVAKAWGILAEAQG